MTGRIDLERLEHSARALFERDARRAGHVLPSSSSYVWDRVRTEYVAQARLALEAAGVPVEPPSPGLKIAQPTLDEATVELLFAEDGQALEERSRAE